MSSYHDKAKWVLDELAKGKSMSEALRAADGASAVDREPTYMRPDGRVVRRNNAIGPIEAGATLVGYVCRHNGRIWWEPAN